MKIFHALVAATALSFSPFAFAHPLAASDGFVNTRQNWNLNDGGLMKRVRGDTIEARQAEIVSALIVIDIFAIVGTSIELIYREHEVRGNEEEFLVDPFD
jgi:hypothetical protein